MEYGLGNCSLLYKFLINTQVLILQAADAVKYSGEGRRSSEEIKHASGTNSFILLKRRGEGG